MDQKQQNYSSLRQRWTLDPDITFLNHGSFGATPRAVLEEQSRLRALMERQPVDFFVRDHHERLDRARSALARFVDADPGDLVFVPNATTGVNTVLRSLPLQKGDEILVTDHAYNACRNALDVIASVNGAAVKVVRLPFPLSTPEALTETILAATSSQTRFVLLDHVTSVSAMVLPLDDIVPALQQKGILVMVDGAHAPGMLPLSLKDVGADFYTGNCHKWMCCPKGAAFLHVRPEHQDTMLPLVISHGWNRRRDGRSLFHDMFDWMGTSDTTALACIPTAINTMDSLFDGGWVALRAHNHNLVVRARQRLLDALGTPACCPQAMLGSMACVALPNAKERELSPIAVHDALRACGIEVPVMSAPDGTTLLRLSAQAYNCFEDYERLSGELQNIL